MTVQPLHALCASAGTAYSLLMDAVDADINYYEQNIKGREGDYGLSFYAKLKERNYKEKIIPRIDKGK